MLFSARPKDRAGNMFYWIPKIFISPSTLIKARRTFPPILFIYLPWHGITGHLFGKSTIPLFQEELNLSLLTWINCLAVGLFLLFLLTGLNKSTLKLRILPGLVFPFIFVLYMIFRTEKWDSASLVVIRDFSAFLAALSLLSFSRRDSQPISNGGLKIFALSLMLAVCLPWILTKEPSSLFTINGSYRGWSSQYALSSAAFFLFAIFLHRSKDRIFTNSLFPAVAISICLVAILASLQRAPMGAIFLISLFAFLGKKNANVVKGYGLGAALCAGLLLMLGPYTSKMSILGFKGFSRNGMHVIDRKEFQQIDFGQIDHWVNTNGRSYITSLMLVKSKNSPGFGHGTGSSKRFLLQGAKGTGFIDPHNEFLRILFELGWLGVALFGICLLNFGFRMQPDTIGLGALISFALLSLFAPTIVNPLGGYLPFLLVLQTQRMVFSRRESWSSLTTSPFELYKSNILVKNAPLAKHVSFAYFRRQENKKH